MLDLVLSAAFIVLLVGSLIVARSLATGVILVALGLGVSGVVLQFVATNGFDATRTGLQWWLLVTLILILVASYVARRRSGATTTRTAVLLLGGSSAAVAVVLLAMRALAPGAPGPLTGVGYLIERTSAEDNAKWLNAAAEIATGAPVDAWANVGGPLLLLLTLSSSVVAALSTLLYGGVNEVALSVGTLILSEFLLIALAPLALAPLVEARLKSPGRRGRQALPWPFLLLSIAIVVTATTLLLNYGHLTLQYTILVLTLWVGTFVAWRRDVAALALTTLTVATTAEVWFPLNVVALVLLVGTTVAGIVLIVRTRPSVRLVGSTALAAVLLILMWEFLRSSITYSLGLDASASASGSAGGGSVRGLVAVDIPTLPLFASPGGTEVVSALVGAVAVVSVIVALVYLRDARAPRPALRFLPVAILGFYTMLVTLADFWAVGKGPGYASNKLTFAVTVPVIAATLPLALMTVDRGRRSMTAPRWFALAGVVVLLVLDTFFPRALLQVKPSLWPTAAGDPQPYWWPAEVRPTADQPLAANPIGCVYLPPGATEPTVLIDGQRAYSCSRLLTGLAGQDVPAAAFVQWTLDEWLQNESLWDHFHEYLSAMPESARNRTVILLDEDSVVVGVTPIESLLKRFPADPVTATAPADA